MRTLHYIYLFTATSILGLTGCNSINTQGISALPAPEVTTATDNTIDITGEKTHAVTARGVGNSAQLAMKNAVESALKDVVSTLVSALNEYTGDKAIDDAVMSELTEAIIQSSMTLLRDSTITSPWTANNKTVDIQAKVSTSALLKNEIVQDLLKRKLEFPKFAILIKNDSGPAKIDLSAFNSISQRFSKYGFEFIPGTISASYVNLIGKVATIEVAETVYHETGAQYLLIGNLKKSTMSKTNEGQAVAIDLEVEVIDGLNRKLLTSISESQVGTGHSIFSAEKSGLKKVLDLAFGKNKIDQDIYNIWLDSLSRFEKKFEEAF